MSDRENPLEAWFGQTGLPELFSPAKTVSGIRDALIRAQDLLEVPPPPVARREDVTLSCGDREIAGRVYIPYGAKEPAGPGLVFYHGGGFIVGSLDGYDPMCQRLAAVSGVRVVSIAYRLAPEHPFPAATDDAFAAFDAVRDGALSQYGFDAGKLAVGGDSAGGNLAASLARERRTAVSFQLLLYPLLQLVEVKKARPRWQEGPFLSTATLREIVKQYVGEADPAQPRISPLMAPDLKGLAPAYLLAAELDPLLDEGKVYAQRLEAFGVKVERVEHSGVPHGFLSASRLMSACIPALEQAARALAKALA
jgi:acetyl esterase